MERIDFFFEGTNALLRLVKEFFVRKPTLDKMETLREGESAVKSGRTQESKKAGKK